MKPVWTKIGLGKSGDRVYRQVEGGKSKYLKISFRVGEIADEARALNWLSGKLPVPKILSKGRLAGADYLLTSGIEGCDASSREIGLDGRELMTVLARAMKRVHSLDISACPLDQRVAVKLRKAARRTRAGLVQEWDFDHERKGMKAAALLRQVKARAPRTEDLVFTHGDFCLPNVILKNGRLAGFVDLGKAGIADRYQDIALFLRSFRKNTGKDLRKVFLAEYGLVKSLDAEKEAFYQSLDEFF